MNNEIEKKLTGKPSIDKPWLKFYSLDAINSKIPEMKYTEYMLHNDNSSDDYVAMQYYDQPIFKSQFKKEIDAVTSSFSKMGIKSGDYVPIGSFGAPEVEIAKYALNNLNAIFKPFDPRTDINGIKHLLMEDKCTHMIMMDAAYSKIRKVLDTTNINKTIWLSPMDWMQTKKEKLEYFAFQTFNKRNIIMPHDSGYMNWNDLLEYGTNYNGKKYQSGVVGEPTDIAGIIYTSGTTGPKKGVELSNNSINGVCHMYNVSDMDYGRGDKLLNIMPPFIAYGLVFTHLAMSNGVECINIPFFVPTQLGELILKYKPQHIVAVPAFIQMLIVNPLLKNQDLSFIKTIALGGDGITPSDEQRLNTFLAQHNCLAKVIKGYGLTEGSSSIATTYNNQYPECNQLGSVGIPLVHNNISVFDSKTNQELSYNQVGEIRFCGPTLNRYHNNSEENMKTINDGWYCTGDIGYIDENGAIYVLDRDKNMIVRYDGHNVFPKEIDNVMQQHKFVDTSVTIGVTDNDPLHMGKQLPKSYVVLKPKYKYFLPKKYIEIILRNWLKQNLPERDCASYYSFIDTIPLTASSGKVDVEALKQMNIKEKQKVLKK